MESAISQPFINRLHNSLVNQCVTKGIIDNKIFDVQDLDEIWDKSAPQYLADAVNEIADYPMVAIAWAAYFGIGSAALWDADWEKAKNINDIYLYLRDMRGFDYIDEFVMEKMMHLSENNQQMNPHQYIFCIRIFHCYSHRNIAFFQIMKTHFLLPL